MDHYRHLLTEHTRLKLSRGSGESAQEQNAESRNDDDPASVAEQPTPKPRKYGAHVGKRKFTDEQKLELVDRLLDSNCTSFADCAALGSQLLHEVGKIDEDVSREYMHSFVKTYPQLRTLIDRGQNGHIDPWAPKTGKKNVYTFSVHRDMRMSGIATNMGNAISREEFESVPSAGSEETKPKEEQVRINCLHPFTAETTSYTTSDDEDRWESADEPPEVAYDPHSNIAFLRVSTSQVTGLDAVVARARRHCFRPSTKPMSAWEANRMIERLHREFEKREHPAYKGRKFTDEQELELSIRVIERIGRTREHIFPVIKAEGERMLADYGKEGNEAKIKSFWTIKYLARYATIQETIQEHLEKLRTRPDTREGTPDPVSDELLLSYPILTPRELEKWFFRCGDHGNKDQAVDACVKKIIKRWSESKSRVAALEDELKRLRAEPEGVRGFDSGNSNDKSSKLTKTRGEDVMNGTNEGVTQPSKNSKELTSSNKKPSSKQIAQRATPSTKRHPKEDKENAAELDQDNPVQKRAPKRRRKICD